MSPICFSQCSLRRALQRNSVAEIQNTMAVCRGTSLCLKVIFPQQEAVQLYLLLHTKVTARNTGWLDYGVPSVVQRTNFLICQKMACLFQSNVNVYSFMKLTKVNLLEGLMKLLHYTKKKSRRSWLFEPAVASHSNNLLTLRE